MMPETMYLVYDTFDNLEYKRSAAASVKRIKLYGETPDEWTTDARNRVALISWHTISGWDGKKYPANPRIMMEIPLETDGTGRPAIMGPDPEWLAQFTSDDGYEDPITLMSLRDIADGKQPSALRRRFEVAYLIATDCVLHDPKTGNLIATDKGRACLVFFADLGRDG